MGIVIPAIDIQNGKCVRLTQGLLEKKTIYYDDPLSALRYWEKQEGVKTLHIVDLDAALGIGTNTELLKKMVNSTDIKLQIGGGIRSLEIAQKYIEFGFARVVIGTSAVQNPSFVKNLNDLIKKESIVVALDMKNGRPAIKGWTDTVDTDIFELGKKMEENGAGHILFSCVEADGAYTGPDIINTKKMVQSLTIPVIAAGGVSIRQDIIDLKKIGVSGVIVGKALYDKRIIFKNVSDI